MILRLGVWWRETRLRGRQYATILRVFVVTVSIGLVISLVSFSRWIRSVIVIPMLISVVLLFLGRRVELWITRRQGNFLNIV